MKKNRMMPLVMGLCLVLSVALTITVASQAAPPANSTCSALCTDLGDLGLNHGECTSFCTSCTNNGNTTKNCACNFLDFIGEIGPGGAFKNFGQCIKALK